MKFPMATVRPLVLWLLLTGCACAAPANEPQAWLERMTAAMSQMSYQGTFVYVQGDNVATMRITHVSDGDGVRERLFSLSGAPREVLRDSNGVRWVSGDDRSVLADSGFKRSFFPQLPLDQQDAADRSYELSLGGEGRVAGQRTRNLRVLPRDSFRYGYSLWLEAHSGLLLKWELIDSDGMPLAKLMFTDIRFGAEVDPSELNSTGDLRRFKTVESGLPVGRMGSKSAPRWKPARLPPGFKLTGHRLFGQDGEGLYEHLIYSDGLAAVSVYVESSGGSEHTPGSSRLGTTHAFTRLTGDVLVTVVGDVPAATVEFIANAVNPVTP
jgi:sigma-E factor negative regulatory protein RseB